MTGFALKLLACAFMLIDHIAQFIPGAPVEMHWIGRLAAPIFLFLMGEGVQHTRSKRNYLLRLYAAGVLMSIMQATAGIPNNIFTTLFSVALIITLLSLDDKRHRVIGMVGYAIYQMLLAFILPMLGDAIPEPWQNSQYVIIAATGYVFDVDGRLFWVIIGVMLWAARKSLVAEGCALTGASLFFLLCSSSHMLAIPQRIAPIVAPLAKVIFGSGNMYADGHALMTMLCMATTRQLNLAFPSSMGQSSLYENYQWMMVFALPFLWLYNGKRGPAGAASKWFFYAFYPAHILVLYVIGSMLGYSYEPWSPIM